MIPLDIYFVPGIYEYMLLKIKNTTQYNTVKLVYKGTDGNLNMCPLWTVAPTSHTNRGLQEWPVGIPLPQIPIEDFRNGLLESFYLTYQYGTTRIAFWNPSTSNTNRRVQE